MDDRLSAFVTESRVLAGQVHTATIRCVSITPVSREGAVCDTLAAASYASVLTGGTASSVNTVSAS